jgi:hypothetical protein
LALTAESNASQAPESKNRFGLRPVSRGQNHEKFFNLNTLERF